MIGDARRICSFLNTVLSNGRNRDVTNFPRVAPCGKSGLALERGIESSVDRIIRFGGMAQLAIRRGGIA